MRVLHLNAGNLYGGIETCLRTLARFRHLAPEMEPGFGLCFTGRLRDELEADGVPVHLLGPVRLSRPWTVLSARRQLRTAIRECRYDVVVTHGTWPHAVFAPAVRQAGVGLVNVVHGNLNRPGRLDRWAARTRPDVVIANSRFTAGPAGSLFAPSPVEVIYLPVPPPNLDDRGTVRRRVRESLGTPADAVVIVQASRFERWKGHTVHLEALARLKDQHGWEAWIVAGSQKPGETELLNELEGTARRASIAGRVKFLGHRSDVPELMAAVDVCCQPNTGPEPFGLVFVEALYAGVAVVTSDFGGATEIVDETCGVRTVPGDPAAVAAALRDLIVDANHRRVLGAAGPRRAEFLCSPARSLKRMARAISRRDDSATDDALPTNPVKPATLAQQVH